MTGRSTPARARVSAPPTAPDALEIRGRRKWPLPKQAVPGAPLLVVEDLSVRFAMSGATVKAVDGVSFRLDDGEALGIAGESGCGKTTTALSLVRLLPANGRIRAGRIELFGIDLVPKTEAQLARYRWREISIVFQGAMNALNPVRRIGEQIAEPIEVRLGPVERGVAPAGGRAAGAGRDPKQRAPRTRTSCRAACASGR